MKTVHSVISLSFLIILLLVNPTLGSSDDWVEHWKDKTGNIYSYNKVSIKLTTKGIVQVWGKRVFSDEGREEFIRIMREKGGLTEGLDKLSYHEDLKEIDCRTKMFRTLSYTMYDKDGNVINSESFVQPNRRNIVPGSVIEDLQKKVCK